MKQRKSMEVFPVVLMVGLSLANLSHLLWTVWLTLEQIKTGWKGGTNIEMLALLPWMTELCCVPVLLAGVVYMIFSFFRKQSKGLLIGNGFLYLGLLLQIFVTNLFMFY